MTTLSAIIISACAIAACASGLWFVFKDRIKNAGALVRAELEPRIATLDERLIGKDAQIGEYKMRCESQELRIRELSDQVSSLSTVRTQLETTLEKERLAAQKELEILNDAQKKLSDAFKSLSADALKSNNESFLELARSALEKYQQGAKGDLDKRQTAIDEMVKPVREALEKFDTKIGEIEKARIGAYEGLREQIQGMSDANAQLRSETATLSKALTSPKVYGRWGEVQLRRLVELSGMLANCDFIEQQNVNTDDGRLRPDMIVNLPAGRTIVVDVKVPMSAYLEAIAADSEPVRAAKLADHVRLVKDHMTALSRKSYWEEFEHSAEFVIMFLPNETFLSAALQQEPALIEQGAAQKIILATPTTLLALLKAVSYGWRHEKLAENAKNISELGNEIYKRLCDMGGHMADLGSRLGKAVESYNKTVASLETRVMVSARRFAELAVTPDGANLDVIEPVQQIPRRLQVPDMAAQPENPA